MCKKTFQYALFSILLMTLSLVAMPLHAAEPASLQTQSNLNADTNTRIQNIFNGLETAGTAYNNNGPSGAALAIADSGCHALIERFLQTKLVNGISEDLNDGIPLADKQKAWLLAKSSGYSSGTMNSLCTMLRGGKAQGVDLLKEADTILDSEILPAVMMAAQEQAHASGIPFLSHIEIEMGVSRNDPIASVTAIQPLWDDESQSNFLFSQVSYHKANNDKDSSGYKTQHSAYNVGLAFRHLTENKKHLYGANVFVDHAPKMNHNRMSIGADYRTSQLAIAANRYLPLSSWRTLDSYLEERAAAGWDLKLSGQIPDLPSWTASLQGYEWDEAHEGVDLYGTVASLEYSPYPAMAVRMGVRDESGEAPSLEAALRFNYNFSEPEALQFKPRTQLADVSDFVYSKVERENIIRVAQRRRASSKLTVTETTGTNTALEATGTSSLSVGKTILMPATITVGNAGGEIVTLRFADGGTLSLGQGSVVTITPTLLTLVSAGTMHYVSGAHDILVAVPGGTITLLGTDIDVVSLNGTDSSVRVRDGSVTLTGTVTGSTTLNVEEMAKTVSGVVGTVAAGTADYDTHTDEISEKIDLLAAPQDGAKVAPYLVDAPRLASAGTGVGDLIVFGLKFNDIVTVSSGTPLLNVTLGSNARAVSYASGSGTDELFFNYTIVSADSSATSVIVEDIDLNGAAIMGNGKDAVTSFVDTTLSLSVDDVVAPSGYTVVFTTDPVNIANVSAAAFSITGGNNGDTYNYTITDTAAGSVTGTNTITTSPQTISGINLSTLAQGTLTVSVTLTDTSSNVGAASTDTVTKDTVAPTISTVTVTSSTYEP